MADLLYVLVIIGFFALMVGFVHLCERIVGTDDAVGTPVDAASTDTTVLEEVPA